MNDQEWIEATVATVTRRPCLAEFQPARFGSVFGYNEPAHWTITIKGIETAMRIEPARVKLRDDEHIKNRVLQRLPESEKAAP